MDVLEGFVDLFGGAPFQAPAPPAAAAASVPSFSAAAPGSAAPASAPEGKEAGAGSAGTTDAMSGQGQGGGGEQEAPQSLMQLLADLRVRVATSELLGSQPLAAMRLLLDGVQPQHLQRDIEQQLPAAQSAAAAAAAAASRQHGSEQAAAALSSAAMPSFALVSPKLAVLVGQLMQYRPAAGAATAEAGAVPDGSAGGGWCGIVFMSQRMATWALDKLLGCACGRCAGLWHACSCRCRQEHLICALSFVRAWRQPHRCRPVPPRCSTLPCTRGLFRTSAIMGLGEGVGSGAFGFQARQGRWERATGAVAAACRVPSRHLQAHSSLLPACLPPAGAVAHPAPLPRRQAQPAG